VTTAENTSIAVEQSRPNARPTRFLKKLFRIGRWALVATTMLIGTLVTAQVTTYQVTGVVGPCTSSSNENCGVTDPVIGQFAFRFDVGGAGGASMSYIPTPPSGGVIDGFYETLYDGTYQMDVTNSTSLPGFPGSEAVAFVTFDPNSINYPGSAELDLTASTTSYSIAFQLRFPSGFQGTGPATGGFLVISGGTEDVTYPIEAATVTQVSSNFEPYLLPGGGYGVFSANLGTANLCPSGSPSVTPCTQTVTVGYQTTGPVTVSGVNVLTSGQQSADFQLASSTCTGSLSAQSLCTVKVTFGPTIPGLRKGVVQLTDASGDVLISTPVYGQGQSPLIAFSTPTTPFPASGLNSPNGVAVDQAGNLFIADSTSVVEISVGGGAEKVMVDGLKSPGGIALDAADNLYVADTGNNRILMVAPNGILHIGKSSNPRVSYATGSAGVATFPRGSFRRRLRPLWVL